MCVDIIVVVVLAEVRRLGGQELEAKAHISLTEIALVRIDAYRSAAIGEIDAVDLHHRRFVLKIGQLVIDIAVILVEVLMSLDKVLVAFGFAEQRSALVE